MAKNSINNKSSSLILDPGASGDSALQLSINTVAKFKIGIDDDDSDKFKISSGSALGTTDCVTITSAGLVNKPLQPTFGAYVSSTIGNVTGDNTTYNIVFDSTAWDVGSNFNTGTGVFVAPVDGKYLLTTCIQFDDFTSSHTAGFFSIIANGVTYRCWSFNNIGGTGPFTDTLTIVGSCYANMDASDSAYVQIRIAGSTKTIDVLGSAGGDFNSSFCGCLIT